MKALKAAFITALIVGVFFTWPLVLTVAVIAGLFWFIYMALIQTEEEEDN
ncbi:hypothetical protein CPT_Pollock57 [Escherichia phage Pollock]|uniref:Uncharacterized protein n=1 Tax=Escherichia phage Pollock TaxID=1540097 RepID=A0A0A0YQZ6_9CAUD|nr:hypothetical protein ACQ44_gp57 [Escherichia phage Pollock]AIX12416.1 hypothetical protein CPT_Pollock57 [Escherichia phage Pollock]